MKTEAGTNFYRALGNGKTAMVAFRDMIEKAVNDGNTESIRFELERVRKDKRDVDALRIASKIVRAVWPEGSFTITSDQQVKIKTSGSTVSSEAVDHLTMLVNDGCSFRGTKIKEVFADGKKTTTWDPNKWADNFAKAHPTQAEFDKAIAALQARRPSAVQAVAA
jgi:hypothetical protein